MPRGKAQSRLNAFKHGLAIPAAALPEFALDVAHLGQTLAGEAADDPVVWEAALRVAEAALERWLRSWLRRWPERFCVLPHSSN
jgi:hypothetical protein